MNVKAKSRKDRRFGLTTEPLEARNLLAVLPVHGMGHAEIKALPKPAMEQATRLNAVKSPSVVKNAARSATPDNQHASRRPAYDITVRFSYVGAPGNKSIGINGFVPPSKATVPAKSANGPGGGYQEIGGVPYIYGIGQTEITAGQYVTFLNKVDPTGADPVQPVTEFQLWTSAFSPVTNPFSGEINLVQNAEPGTHYQLAARYWANKPLVNGNMFDFAYFVNSMYNGTTVAIDNRQARSPLGFHVHLQTRFVKLSTNISTGMYDLQDSSYQFFQRLDTTGYVVPSENEWVKAAYYSPLATGNGTHYFYYPTVSNTPPTALSTSNPKPSVNNVGNIIQANLVPGVAYSNYNESVNWQPPYDPLQANNDANVADVGKDRTPSPWLTYDQGGNAVEYTDTVAAPPPGVVNPHNLSEFVKVHGGIANAKTYQLWLTATGTSSPYGQDLGQTDTQGGARFGYVPNAHTDRSIRTSKGVSSSALAKPRTSDRLVYRLDNLNTLDTYYTTNLTQAINLANDPSTYVFLGASFQQPAVAQSKPVFGFLNTTTRTQFYTTNTQDAAVMSANPQYSAEGVVFKALAPNVGSTNYRQFFNSTTGAYAYSAANADVQFFTSRGYQFDGYAWSVN
jgi:hypothetical protein